MKRPCTPFEAEVIPIIICSLSVSGVEESNYKLMKHEHRGLQNTGNYDGKRPVHQCLQGYRGYKTNFAIVCGGSHR